MKSTSARNRFVIAKMATPLPPTIQLGLCCINMALQERKITCSRKPIMRTARTQGVQVLVQAARANCQDLLKLLAWNAVNGIRVFRISSELFPHYANPQLTADPATCYSMDCAQDLLTAIGEYARQTGQRLTFHPGQYNVLATPHEDIYQKTLQDLGMHAEILDRMGCPPDSVMVVHGGGLYGDKPTTMARWIERYKNAPEPIRRRLVLENCEKCFSVIDCLAISEQTGVPVVLDLHHFACYLLLHPKEAHLFQPVETYYAAVIATWQRRGIKPKFHISSQAPGARTGAHADYITAIPDHFLAIPTTHQVSVDLMIEAKHKERAIIRLWGQYPPLCPPEYSLAPPATSPPTLSTPLAPITTPVVAVITARPLIPRVAKLPTT